MFRQVVRQATRYASEGTGMRFSFASATQQHYSEATNVTQIDLPTGTGMMGILPDHVPSLGVLAAGWATVYENGQPNRIFVSSGSYTIQDDGSVSIAAEEAVAEADIDLDAARKALDEIKAEGNNAKSEAEKVDAQIAAETMEALLK